LGVEQWKNVLRHQIQKTKNKMAKELITERFQKLAGIKTAGLALSEEESDMKEHDILLRKLKDILKTWETKEYESPVARFKEYYKDIEDLVREHHRTQVGE